MKFPFFNKQKTAKKWYLGLFLKEQEGLGIAMSWENGQMRMIEKEKFNYSDGWENLIQDTDELLLRMEQKLQIQFSDTIFFVYSHFIDEKAGDIKKPYLQKIKELVKSLELRPLGYVECHEAVVNYLEKREEMPLTAIVAELDKTQISVFVYKGGHIVHKKILARTYSLVDDFIQSFETLKGKVFLPARIILYNSKDLDDESARILTHRWSEEYFVQIPRVEVVGEEEVVDGLVKIFSNQISEGEVDASKIETPVPKAVMGFVVGEDVSQDKPEAVPPPKIRKSFRLPAIKLDLSFFKNLSGKLKVSGRLSVIAGLFIIIAGLVINEFFLHKAQLKLLLPSQSINKTLSVTVPLRVATATADFSESKTTTGSRDIGDPARGSVTVHNFADAEKIFPKGTAIVSGGITFTLDIDVKVASSSLAVDGSAKLPGKNSVKVTAAAIGPESNLNKGKRFSITDLPVGTYFAIADNALTGGTKKTVRTVAKKDTQDLKALIMEKAKKDQPKLTAISAADRIISPLSEIDLQNLDFSKEVGEEADNINLKAKAESTYYLYDKNELINNLIDSVKSEVKSDYVIEKNNISYKIEAAEKKDDRTKLKIDLNVKTIKKTDTAAILKSVKGKPKNSIEALLKNNFQIQGYELDIKEPLPILNNFLPFFEKNITLLISSL